MAEIVTQMVEHDTDLSVTQIKNLGSTTMTHIAMEKKSLNVVGGAVASICVAKSEGLLNEEKFNA